MEYDVIVVGGGASGLFCAAHTAAAGLKTLVLEKRERPARKLMITGKGRCNLTNDCPPDVFLQNVVRGGRFLYAAANRWQAADTMGYFEALGVPLKTERGSRVYPVSDSAGDVVDALLNACKRHTVVLRCATAKSLLVAHGRTAGVLDEKGERHFAKRVVLATGGLSYPATGSTGDGYRMAKTVGHTIIPTAPALVSLITREKEGKDAAGLSLRNVTLSLFDKKKPKKPVFCLQGELLFTHTGLSGPLVLSASSFLDASRPADFFLSIDCKPALSPEVLDKRILRDFSLYKNRDFCNALGDLLPRALIDMVVARSGVAPSEKVNAVTRQQRAALCGVIKALRFDVADLGGYDEAVVTRGGVALGEINPSSMQSKILPGLFLVGEMIDADALTGGYNLQLAFSTAYLAAQTMIEQED